MIRYIPLSSSLTFSLPRLVDYYRNTNHFLNKRGRSRVFTYTTDGSRSRRQGKYLGLPKTITPICVSINRR